MKKALILLGLCLASTSFAGELGEQVWAILLAKGVQPGGGISQTVTVHGLGCSRTGCSGNIEGIANTQIFTGKDADALHLVLDKAGVAPAEGNNSRETVDLECTQLREFDAPTYCRVLIARLVE